MNPFKNYYIYITVKVGQTVCRFVHQTTGVNGDVPEMYIMTTGTFTTIPTSFNDGAQPTPTPFTNTEFMSEDMRHEITCKVDSSATAVDEFGNEYMKVIPM